MKALIVDEKGIWKNGERIVTSREFKEIEIPDELLFNFKTAYEIWMKEQQQKKESVDDAEI